MRCTKIAALALSAMMIGTIATAENWDLIAWTKEEGGLLLDIDLDSIKAVDNKTYRAQTKITNLEDDTEWGYLISTQLFRCETNEMATERIEYYARILDAKRVLETYVPSSIKWESPRANTLGAQSLRHVCKAR